MAEKLHTTRRAVLSGLAAMPLAAIPLAVAPAIADDAQARYKHHLEGLKQAIRDLSPSRVEFCKDIDDETGLMSHLMVIQAKSLV